jgi:hypothetical protein
MENNNIALKIPCLNMQMKFDYLFRTTYNGGTCWMKTGAVTKSDAFATTDQTMVCGLL